MKRILTLLLLLATTFVSWGYDIAIENADGVTIYYNYINDATELEVTQDYSNGYYGSVVIPAEVTYMNRKRKVTSIGDGAFFDCSDLTSITIPNSVTSIGDGAFADCWSLTSITIGNKVTIIGEQAFANCESLTSITIPNSVTSIGWNAFGGCSGLTSITIPNSVTSIGDDAFQACSGLTSITIPNSMTSIGNRAFELCSGLTSVTIPNSVTSIGDYAFYKCIALTSIIIPNSVTSIGDYAFNGCSDLTSIKVESENTKYDSRNNCNAIIETESNTLIVGCQNTTIPNSVMSIGDYAFNGCSGLTSITIPNSVTSIGYETFSGCSGLTSITIPESVTCIGEMAFSGCDIPEVISKIDNPFVINVNTFSDNTFYNAKLYVPKGTIDKYRATEGWKKFSFIEEGDGGGENPEPPTPQKCTTPTIAFENGKIVFDCETEDVEFVYSFSSTSVNQQVGNNISLPTTYTVTVYAKKDGCINSDTVTQEIQISGGATTDVNGDGVVDTQDVLEIYKYIQEH